MESNKNDNNNGDNEHEQPQRSAQKRKLNELTNDEEPAEAAGQEDQDFTNSKKNREEGNDLLDLELESLSREELINLVRKRIAMTMETEAQKQLETAKKEAEESAKQAEEFSQRNIQLEQEKAKLHEDLHQKIAEIGEMHKEVEEKSEQLAEKAKQINTLLAQLNESTSHQPQLPTEEEMKIQLSLETWYDMLAFVPRHRLGQIVTKIGRKFGSIVQKFLHGYGEIKIDHIEIVAPYEEDPVGHPRVQAWQNDCPLRFEMAETQMPANIKNFNFLGLRYFDEAVLKFMQKFQQNGLLDNVNLCFDELPSKDIFHPVLCNILPLIKGIKSIVVADNAQLVDFYDTGNKQEIYEMNMKMMEETRILGVSYHLKNMHANTITIDLYRRWLYQIARADGKPRVLDLIRKDVDHVPISHFIERLKQDFLMATDPFYFFIRIILPKAFPPQEDICLDNDKTKERLLTKMEETKAPFLPDYDEDENKDDDDDEDNDDDDDEEVKEEEVVLLMLISRYPLGSTKKWIEENEKEVLAWDFCVFEKTICLVYDLEVVSF